MFLEKVASYCQMLGALSTRPNPIMLALYSANELYSKAARLSLVNSAKLSPFSSESISRDVL